VHYVHVAQLMKVSATSPGADWNGSSVQDSKKVGSGAPQFSYGQSEHTTFKSVLRDSSVHGRSPETNRSASGVRKEQKKASDSQSTDAAGSTVPETRVNPAPIAAMIGLPSNQVNSPGGEAVCADAEAAAISIDTQTSAIDAQTSAIASNTGLAEDTLAGDRQVSVATSIKGQDAQQSGADAKLVDLLMARGQGGNPLRLRGEEPLISSSVELQTEEVTPDSSLSSDPYSGNSAEAKSGVSLLQPAGNLAFAMRLSNGQLQGNPSLNEGQDRPNLSGNLESESRVGVGIRAAIHPDIIVQSTAESELEQHSSHTPDRAFEFAVPESIGTRQSGTEHNSEIADGSHTSPVVETEPEPSVGNSDPIKNVQLQLVSDDNRRVDVRLMDRGGELHVSVKSADPALTQNLQSHMPELTSRLDQQHLQSEVWTPKTSEQNKAEMSESKGFTTDGGSRGDTASSGDRRGQQQQQPKPDWVEALESYS
jgi:Flagellar hook-length control protein FliK